MGSAASCLSGGNSNEGQSFVRRKVSRSEIARPLTKKLSKLRILNRDSTSGSGNDDDVASRELTPFMNADGKLAESKDAEGNKNVDLVMRETLPLTIENITNSDSDAEEHVKSVKERISAFEGHFLEAPLSLQGKLFTTSAMDHRQDIGVVKDKIAKFNALEQRAGADLKAEVRNVLRDPLVVKKSTKFLARVAVFEKTTQKGLASGAAGTLRIVLEPETSSEEGNDVPKKLGSGGSSPRRVADFVSS